MSEAPKPGITIPVGKKVAAVSLGIVASLAGISGTNLHYNTQHGAALSEISSKLAVLQSQVMEQTSINADVKQLIKDVARHETMLARGLPSPELVAGINRVNDRLIFVQTAVAKLEATMTALDRMMSDHINKNPGKGP